MSRKYSIYLTVGLMGMAVTRALPQITPIGGTINTYTSIDSIYSLNNNDVDSLIVASTAGFDPGDTVMVYCVQGAEIETTDIYGEEQIGRDAQNPRNTGKYALVIISTIDAPRGLVVLNTTIRKDDEIKPLGQGEVAQLIKVPSYRNARVTATGITAAPWNGSTGGVVALFVHGVLRLDGDIDVTGAGFRGAGETVNYEYDCSSVDPVLYDSSFYHIDNVRAGKKGESTTDTRFNLLRGKAMNISGGGGGNGLFSGGGGGSNYSSGGNGGNESSQCEPGVASPGGRGGFDLSRPGAYYINGNSFNRGNRVFLGGGGGTGTRRVGRTTTGGANGGGIVVIVADTIVGNGHWIIADGGDVTTAATGAAGGGGGGGAIILDVMGYRSTLNLSAVGGKGGDTNHPSDTTGPGGGGGGGIYWLAKSTQPGVNPLLFTNGPSGENLTHGVNFGASDGVNPGKVNNLIAPLKGFIFNSVPSAFTVCSDELPEPILASLPRGGDGPGSYAYQWVDSSATQPFWDIAPGVSNQQNYSFPATLSDTTYFRRIVTSGILPPDTSFRVAVYVHPAITGNTVAAPDTVCSGDAPQLFSPSAAIGGGPTGGTYTYQWLKDEGTGYAVADGTGTGASYQAPGLTVSTGFARIAQAGVCVDTSDALYVQVWEPLTGNDITPYDTICYNTAPDQITGPVPGAGDPADKRYRWEEAAVSTGPWSEVSGATAQDYQPPALTQTTWYRRVALSGSGDACVDNSPAVEILNIPLITGNAVSGTQTVCTFDQPELLAGSDPGGGYQSQYSYQWQSRTLSTGWVPAEGVNSVKSDYDPGIMDGDTTWYRRVVGSGGSARNVCLNPSDSIPIHVLPSITNNVITTTDPAIKCQWDLTDPITQDPSGGATPGGGATQGGTDPTRQYQWETASGTGSPGSWSIIDGETDIDYAGQPVLDDEEDRWFRRIIFSGPGQVCKDTSASLVVTVHTQITGNTIAPFDSVCFADTKLLSGSTPQGEAGLTPVYIWRALDGGGEIPGSGFEDYTTQPFNALGAYRYDRIISIGECSDTSNTMQVTVMQLPGGVLTDGSFIACEKDTVLAVDLNAEQLQTYVFPWEVYLYDGVDAGMIGPIMVTGDGPLDITLDIDTDSLQQNYSLAEIVYRSPGGRYTCVSPLDSLAGSVPVQVFRKPEPQILVDGVARDSFKVCNTTVDLFADADNGISSWSVDPPVYLFFTPGTGQDEYLATIPNVHDAFGKYTITFTSVAGDCYDRDAIDLHYFEQPAPAFAGNDTVLFIINSVQLNADPATAGSGTWELISGSGTIADAHAYNTFAYELGLGEENTFRWTVENGEDEGRCITTNDVTIVLHNEVKRYSGFSPENGDALNQYFIMQGLKYADEFTITIFNALGNTVRTITHENIGEINVDPGLVNNGLREDELVVWDGRANNGNLVPSGTYYYAVEFLYNERDQFGNIIRAVPYDFKGYVLVVRD